MGLIKAAASVLLLALASSAAALPTSSTASPGFFADTHVVESLASPPKGWARVDNDDGDGDDGARDYHAVDKDAAQIRLRLHLVHQDMDRFHAVALDIATPGHARYGGHLSQKAIDAMIAPSDESGDLVMAWLESAGLRGHASFSDRGDSVVVEAPVSQIEKLLGAEYGAYYNSEMDEYVLRTLEFSLPTVLAGHVDMVQPTTFFGFRSYKSAVKNVKPLSEAATKTKTNAAEAVKGCSSNVNPTCLSNLYGFADAKDYTTGLFGIAGFLEQYAIASDLTTFLSKYAVEGNEDDSFTCVSVNDGECPTAASEAGIEANLDVQYGRAIAESVPISYYSTGGRGEWIGGGTNTNEPYTEFLEYLLGLDDADLPNTLSISYGDDEDTVPDAYATNACNLFSQLGARGVSVLVASGDSGVASSTGDCSVDGVKQFTTSFPAACPWVTTVGGTTGQSPESAWSSSGGGFSSLFGQPAYQATAVNAWLTDDKTHQDVTDYFNASGRAYPDVAAQSTDFVIVVDGSSELVDGTSCAAPTFAAVIQLVNSDRIANGKTGLGFLNPWLYSNASDALTDITSGSNGGCRLQISGAGFDAVSGWDPVTGLGTPVYSSLLAVSSST